MLTKNILYEFAKEFRYIFFNICWSRIKCSKNFQDEINFYLYESEFWGLNWNLPVFKYLKKILFEKVF